MRRAIITIAVLAGLAACEAPPPAPPQAQGQGATPAAAGGFHPSSPVAQDLLFMRPYSGPDDLCYLVGETATVRDLLDDAADLVACPLGFAGMDALLARGRKVAQVGPYSLISVGRR